MSGFPFSYLGQCYHKSEINENHYEYDHVLFDSWLIHMHSVSIKTKQFATIRSPICGLDFWSSSIELRPYCQGPLTVNADNYDPRAKNAFVH